jgi:hypothetical protein
MSFSFDHTLSRFRDHRNQSNVDRSPWTGFARSFDLGTISMTRRASCTHTLVRRVRSPNDAAQLLRQRSKRVSALRSHPTHGREIAISVDWFPRLAHATTIERQKWELIGRGVGIH